MTRKERQRRRRIWGLGGDLLHVETVGHGLDGNHPYLREKRCKTEVVGRGAETEDVHLLTGRVGRDLGHRGTEDVHLWM